MENDLLIVRQENTIACVQIHQPKTLNALNAAILKALHDTFEQLCSDDSVRVIILTGAERSFVAGADIQAMMSMNYTEAKAFGKLGASVFRKIETCSKPVIAAVNGFALGGGCELVLACDIRIASEKAKFGQPEVSLGITPGFSGTQRLTRAVGFAKAKELIYTGKVIGAEEALNIGLINSVVPSESLMEESMQLAQLIAKQAPIAVQNAKKAMNEGWDLSIEQGIDLEIELFARCFETEDQKQGMQAFLKKEKVEFKGK